MAALAAASGLGIAEALGLGQGVSIGSPGFVDGGEDVIGGAVDDPQHPGDRLPGQRLHQRADQRDATPDRSFEQEGHTFGGGGIEQGRPFGRHQLLVGSHHRFTRRQGPEDQTPGRFQAPHQLHHQRHVGIVDHLLQVGGGVSGREGPGLVEVPHRHLDQLQVEPGLASDGGPIVQQASGQ
jgi:hypothetical protein